MNRIVNDYLDFINESKLEFLLEAKIQFMSKFSQLISKINSPVKDALEGIVGKDVDVNTNFIDISDKDDSITFIPDDKIDSVNYVVNSKLFSIYTILAQTARVNNSYPIGYVSEPIEGTIGKIVAEPTIEELNNIMPSNWEVYVSDNKLVHFSWDNGGKNTFIIKSGLNLDMSNYKSTEYKVGKFVNKILTKAGYDFTPVQIEDFVNKYKTQMKLRNNALSRFEIVKGEDIRKYYLSNTYFNENGSLGGSCMKSENCQPYFDIYVDNPEQVSLVILKEERYLENKDSDKITGRALLWRDNKGRHIMDRIYVNNTEDIEFFKQFANENGFLYKKEQDFNKDTPFILNNVKLSKEESIIVVKLKENIDYNNGYPYMDTLKYYTIRTGILTNELTKNRDYFLEDTMGNLGPCDFCLGVGEVDCPQCFGVGRVDCTQCDGKRYETCDFCDGNKITDCPSCDGNDKECQLCNGEGELSCPKCDGEGRVDCSECDAAGDIKCFMCDGNGEVDCPECG
jgi:hypothetical protein